MPNQSGQNVVIAYKAQSGLGTPATGAGGLQLRILPGSPGLQKQHAVIENQSVRSDGQTSLGRHGMASVPGSHKAYLAVGELDTLIAAVLRSTPTASVDITQSTMTSITTTTNTIVAAAGSWITQGVHQGDLVKLTGHSTAANNGKWFRVLGVTTSTITLPAGSLTLDAVADTTFTLTVAKTIVQGAAPVETYFTWDEWMGDMDTSWITTDTKVTSLDLSMAPNANIEATIGLMGLNQTTATTGSAPSLTNPTQQTTLPLVMGDGTLRVNGVDYGTITAFSLKIEIPATIPPVIAPTAPDVFLGNAKVTGSMSIIRSDTALWAAFDAETQMDVFVNASENTTDPKNFCAFYLGKVVLDSPNAPLGSEGPLVATYAFRAGIDDAAGTSHQSTTVKFSTSAA